MNLTIFSQLRKARHANDGLWKDSRHGFSIGNEKNEEIAILGVSNFEEIAIFGVSNFEGIAIFGVSNFEEIAKARIFAPGYQTFTP